MFTFCPEKFCIIILNFYRLLPISKVLEELRQIKFCKLQIDNLQKKIEIQVLFKVKITQISDSQLIEYFMNILHGQHIWRLCKFLRSKPEK